jgi:hypothetical protein
MSNDHHHLVFLETSGNQSYIYATNRLRENVGASELTARVGMHWLAEALGRQDLRAESPRAFRECLREKPDCSGGEEIVLATSGKAMVLVPSRERGRELIRAISTRALTDAPGLSVAGAIVPLASRSAADASIAIRDAHTRFEQHRGRLQGAYLRDANLPFAQPCASSGAPASGWSQRQKEAQSAAVAAKVGNADSWFNRVGEILRPEGFGQAHSIDKMERLFESMDWLGVIYSDGNGLGQIMLDFHSWVEPGQDYFATLRAFSLALDDATEAAFLDAARMLSRLLGEAEQSSHGRTLPLVPLLLGGDDLTLLVHGRYALPVAQAFLLAFERHTRDSQAIRDVAKMALGVGKLSAAAGVAIVKPHYPYHAAQGLADGLLRSAKLAKKHVRGEAGPYPCSALDFHVLFDAANVDLDELRQRRRLATDGARLWGGPYVITPIDELASTGEAARAWAQRQSVQGLLDRIRAMSAREEGRLRLPANQTHALRESLSAGAAVSDAALRERAWLNDRGLNLLKEDGESLFRRVDNQPVDTRFLDAITACDFWPGLQHGEPA